MTEDEIKEVWADTPIGAVIFRNTIARDRKSNRKRLRYIYAACENCGKPRWVIVGEWKKKLKRYCHSCGYIQRGDIKGSKHATWKGGKPKTGQGYVDIHKSLVDPFFCPMATKKGYILEHRLVMAKYLNRCLLSWEIVHHKNGIKTDNRIENLELMSNSLKHNTLTRMAKYIEKLEKEIKILEFRLKEALNG